MIEPLFAPQPPGWLSGAEFSLPPVGTPLVMSGTGGLDVGLVSMPALLTSVAIRRGQPQGPATDADIEDFLADVFDLLPNARDVEVRSEAGRITLAGTVAHKRVKHDLGEIAWAIPRATDVQNNLTITARRRSRGANRDAEPNVGSAGRKTA